MASKPLLTLDTLRRNYGAKHCELIHKREYSKAVSFALDTKMLARDLLPQTDEVKQFTDEVTKAGNCAKLCRYSDNWKLSL